MHFFFFFKPVRQCVTLQIERGGGAGAGGREEKQTDRLPHKTLRSSSASGYNENTQRYMQVKSCVFIFLFFFIFFSVQQLEHQVSLVRHCAELRRSVRISPVHKEEIFFFFFFCNLAFDFNPHKPRSICSLFTLAREKTTTTTTKQTLTDINLIGKSCERSVKEPQ